MSESRYPYVHVEVDADAAEAVSVELWELGAAGVEERDAATLSRGDVSVGSTSGGTANDAALGVAPTVTLVANFADEAVARQVVEHFAGRCPAHLEFVVGDAWRDAWKAYFRTLQIGERLVVRPPWEAYEPQDGEVVVVLDPGRAFGTGTHETTRLVLEELEQRLRGGERLLDVGCGSGILGIAALKLGAAACVVVDNDADALVVAEENATINGVSAGMQIAGVSLDCITERFALVLANIEARVLVPLAPALSRCTAPDGVLVLSGILAGQEAEVLAAYPTMRLYCSRMEGDWVALVLQQKGP